MLQSKTFAGLAFAAGLFLAGATQAQNVICFSFDSDGKTTGKTASGRKSRTGVTIGGHGSTFLDLPAGSSNEDAADALNKELAKKGFTAKKVGKNVVCVSAGPGNKPLTSGGGIGTTDSGMMRGVDCEVMKPPVAPPPPKKPIKKAKSKTSGVCVPKLRVGFTFRVRGRICMVFEAMRWTPTGYRRIILTVKVIVQIGWTSQYVNGLLLQQMRRVGLVPQDVLVPSIFDQTQLVPSWGIDFNRNGDTIQHAIYLPHCEQQPLDVQVSAGRTDVLGVTAYGSATTTRNYGPAPFLHADGFASPGQRLFVGVENAQPRSAMALLIGFAPMEWNFGFGRGNLLVDPLGSLLLLGSTNDFGHWDRSMLLPPAPGLVGLELYSQALLDAGRGQKALTNGLQVKVFK